MNNNLNLRSIFTVSELTQKIKSLIEDRFSFVWLSGEISNFRIPSSGHYYFTLKDAHAQINTVMFRGQNRNLKFLPEDGMQINGLGRISIYEPRGTYQIILEYMEPGGVGALQVAFEQLKKKLRKEGLFAVEHKQALPFMPQKISLITSPSGAVVHDILKIVNRRFANVQIQVIACKVQGKDAEEEIVDAIQLLNRQNDADVAILARGGGSLEDLQPFNSEGVAKAIFDSAIPIISAVGHETDYTIADFVADIRVPTPSAAAEIVVPVKDDLKYTYIDLHRQLTLALRRYIERRRTRLNEAKRHLKDPKRDIQDLRIHIDSLTERLLGNFQRNLEIRRERMKWRIEKLAIHNPVYLSNLFKAKLYILYDNLIKSIAKYIIVNQNNYRKTASALHMLSPTAILSRGYSITRTVPDKTVVRDAGKVSKGQKLEILLGRGSLFVAVHGFRGSKVKKIESLFDE